jgi:hypothetical protein
MTVYVQIGLVMLIGLSAKNSILIVEFAEQLIDQGRSVINAAIEAAELRLRPILMTSVAYSRRPPSLFRPRRRQARAALSRQQCLRTFYTAIAGHATNVAKSLLHSNPRPTWTIGRAGA